MSPADRRRPRPTKPHRWHKCLSSGGFQLESWGHAAHAPSPCRNQDIGQMYGQLFLASTTAYDTAENAWSVVGSVGECRSATSALKVANPSSVPPIRRA